MTVYVEIYCIHICLLKKTGLEMLADKAKTLCNAGFATLKENSKTFALIVLYQFYEFEKQGVMGVGYRIRVLCQTLLPFVDFDDCRAVF
ncbi:hypothetical protein EGR_10712 [Echinococcus granulosus]|uniref:Uncharacterized protein n=1 Tax=Echinococcus granulosus TaxID=6210 RepID=W6U012_ECHGR|nr:hypothetical protein EGR_10712 [Echinococcus granulosus]EUB54425.1 hypothetical protein EGR_10712 [Echinococcus granulosus]